MKITDIVATAVSHPTDTANVRLGIGQVRKHDFVLVKVTTDEDLVGYGESHHALAPTAVAELVNTSLRDLMIGQDALATEDLLGRAWHHQMRSHGLGTGVAIAYSGIDMALWDLKGKSLGLPVCRLLGSAPKSFPAYAGGLSLGFQEPGALVEEALHHVETSGFRAVKLRAGDSVRADAARIRAVRDALGEDFEIMVDINARYDVINVEKLIPVLEECDVSWLEEPVAPVAMHALRNLRRNTRVPIALGENHLTRLAFDALIQTECVDVIQADASKAGGITELKKIGDLTSLHELRFAPHCSHTPLNYAATLHVMSAVEASWYFEAAVQSSPFGSGLFRSPFSVVGGRVETPDLPGLGVEVDEEALAHFEALPGAAYVI